MSSPTLTFTPAMFHASLKGTKNTTRRLIQLPIEKHRYERINRVGPWVHFEADLPETVMWTTSLEKAPHAPGQIKPMVTSWAVSTDWDDNKPLDIEKDILLGEIASDIAGLWFDDGSEKPAWAGKMRPARFLPKSLYALAPQVEILTVTPEFLHDITEASALLDGIQPIGDKFGVPNPDGDFIHQAHTAREAYFKLWDSINAAKDHGQYAAKNNPACWVITYRVLPSA